MAVYMIRAGENGPVKIGHAADPVHRLGTLQIAHYEALKIARLFAGGEPEEATLHFLFADLRIRGEWFAFSRKMMGDVGLVDVPIPSEPTQPPAIEQVIAESIGYRIAAARKARRLSQRAFGNLVGVSGGAVCQWESCGLNPSIERLHKVARVLNVSTDWLLAREAA